MKNEEESDYYDLLKKDDDNCKKDISIQYQIYHYEENKEKEKNRKVMLYQVLEEMIMKKLISLLREKKLFKVFVLLIMI